MDAFLTAAAAQARLWGSKHLPWCTHAAGLASRLLQSWVPKQALADPLLPASTCIM